MDAPNPSEVAGLAEPAPSSDRLEKAAAQMGWIAAAIGGLVLLGWAADLSILRSPFPGQVPVRPNAAACLILTGLALAGRAGPGAAPSLRRLAWAGALAALAISGLTLVEYATARDGVIDRLLFHEAARAVDPVMPGRMTLPASVSFLLLSLAALALGSAVGRRIAPPLGLAAAVVSSLAFLGYLFDLPRLASFGPYAPLPPLTGITLLLLGAGVLLAASSPTASPARRSGLGLGFALALALLLVLGIAVVRNTHRLAENNRMVTHTHEVLNTLSAVLLAMQDLETGSRGYLLTGSADFLEPARDAPEAVTRRLAELRELIADNPAQSSRAVKLERLVAEKTRLSVRLIELAQAGADATARGLASAGEGQRLMEAIRSAIAGMEVEERRLLRERQQRAQASTGRTLLAFGTGLTASVGLLVAVYVLLRREIAARTRLATALRQSEQSLAVTLRSIGDGVLATDTAGRVTLMNPVAENLTGWPLAQARGRLVTEVFRIVHEHTRAPAEIPVGKVLATGDKQELANHTALLARDGSERLIADSAAPIRGAGGQLLGVVLVFRDVTRERADEARLAAAHRELDQFFSLSLDFLCISSADGYFRRVSPAVTDILGWTEEEFLARPYLEQVHPDDREATRQQVENQVRRGERVFHFENRYRHKDGSWRTLAWRSVPQGELMYATARDVTDSRQAEEQVRDLNRTLRQHAGQLEVVNRELESFSYSVSHDLRAPLRHVQGYVQMLTREVQGNLSEKGQRYLHTIAEAAREMGTLIDDLLAFSRMGRAEMREGRVETAALVEEVRAGLAPESVGRDIRWAVGSLPAVRGDAAMLRLVFANLLGNAVKYTRRRAVAEIAVGCRGDEDGCPVFFVRDNGAGFDMKYAEKLFGVFQRLHRADEFEGTGIGLATVRRIVGRHGGRTWAESQLDAGATFYFTLPPAADTPATGHTPS